MVTIANLIKMNFENTPTMNSLFFKGQTMRPLLLKRGYAQKSLEFTQKWEDSEIPVLHFNAVIILFEENCI